MNDPWLVLVVHRDLGVRTCARTDLLAETHETQWSGSRCVCVAGGNTAVWCIQQEFLLRVLISRWFSTRLY